MNSVYIFEYNSHKSPTWKVISNVKTFRSEFSFRIIRIGHPDGIRSKAYGVYDTYRNKLVRSIVSISVWDYHHRKGTYSVYRREKTFNLCKV